MINCNIHTNLSAWFLFFIAHPCFPKEQRDNHQEDERQQYVYLDLFSTDLRHINVLGTRNDYSQLSTDLELSQHGQSGSWCNEPIVRVLF